MSLFTVYPAIDLREGKVVRLLEGDLSRQTQYSNDPASVAQRWIDAGARYLHVVNLDGAFQMVDDENFDAIQTIIALARNAKVPVQLGGGVQTLMDIENLLHMGVTRVILGTAAVQQPQMIAKGIAVFGEEKIMVSIDARDGIVRTRGWQDVTALFASDFAVHLAHLGLKWLVYTDIARDGMLQGINLEATLKVAEKSSLNVIASGGVRDWADIEGAARANLAGVIVGKALYESKFTPAELLSYTGADAC